MAATPTATPREGNSSASQRRYSADATYSAEDVDDIVRRLERASAKQKEVKSSIVKLRAAERDLLAQAEDGRNLLQLAVKGSKTLLEEIFGGDCERIGRLHIVITDVEFTDMHASDARWNDLKAAIETIEAVLKEAGMYKPWTPPETIPPSNIRCKGARGRFGPGESVYMKLECDGDEVNSFTVEPALPNGIELDPVTGSITGVLKCGDDLPETTYVVTATNDAGSDTFELTFAVGMAPPGSISYPRAQPECYTGEALIWEASVPGGAPDVFAVDPDLPSGFSFNTTSGAITGMPLQAADEAAYVIRASNKSGEVSTTLTFAVKVAPPIALSYPQARGAYAVGEGVYLSPELALQKFNDNTLNKLIKVDAEEFRHLPEVTYTIAPGLPDGLELAENTGVISGKPTVTTAEALYSVTVRNTGGMISTDLTFGIRLTAPTDLSYPEVLAQYFRGQLVSLSPQVTGIVTEWSVVPSLPAGLELDASIGEIRGTPTAVTAEGPGSWKVFAKNEEGQVTTTLSFAVVRAPPSNLQYPSLRSAYPLLVKMDIRPKKEGEVDEYSITPALPEGIAMDPKTGIISGTPSRVTEPTSYKVLAQSETGEAETEVLFAVEVMAPAELRYPRTDEMYTMGEDISLEPEIVGGANDWSVEPALPAGMVLDTATGSISGAPEVIVPEVAYQVTASNDAGSTTAVLTFSVTHPPPDGLSYPEATNNFCVGEEVTLEPEVEGGSCDRFSVDPEFPPGLVLDARTGVISGAATEIVEFATYTITARNAKGSTICELGFECLEPEEAEVDQAFAAKIEEITEIAELMEEPNKAEKLGDWMIWMVHRAWLDDETLVEFDFSNRIMPLPYVEKRIAPKLMQSLHSNTHIKALLLPNSNLQKQQGHELAEALKVNKTIEKLNIENNMLDSDAVRDVADALCQNAECAIEQFRTAYQKQVGAFFGRPVEEKFGQLMDKNTRIIKLGFVCNDAHWRNSIDRALLRNNDIARRLRKRGESAYSEEIAAKEKSLSKLLLSSSPDKAVNDFFPDEDANLRIIRGYVSSNKKLPTPQQLQSYAKSQSTPLKYAVLAPLLKDFREKIVNSTVGTELTVADDYYVETVGQLRAWSEKNENWSLDVWPSPSERFNFVSNKHPIIEVSEVYAEWLRPSA